MTDELQTPAKAPSGSALTFALGSLTARVEGLTAEQQRSRESIESMPAKLVAIIMPQILALQVQGADHTKRLESLEKDRWKMIGATGAVIVIGGVVIGHTVKLPYLG